MLIAELPHDIVDQAVYDRTVERFRRQRISLPTFAELADPTRLAASKIAALGDVEPDSVDPANLNRVHWFNAPDRRGRVEVPQHLVLPTALTGVASPILVMVGRLFPMIRAHKVLAAYSCLVPHLVTGGFDPTTRRAVWPSTGNYARGGVAISRLMGCHGVAVLPEGMSRERFEWLARWTVSPDDVIRTAGTESNVKEIYDACAELALDPVNRIFNQFSEYANHLGHWAVTGSAAGRVFESFAASRPNARLAAFVSATGSAGTIAAGDALKDLYGSRVVAVEALECPTMLYNGYGAHNIQGIGDKHIPLIHNVTNTDVVVGVSDRATDSLDVLFNSAEGRRYLIEHLGVDAGLVAQLDALGLSGICNVLAAIKTAKQCGLGPEDVIVTVATDGAELYVSERDKTMARLFPAGFGATEAAATTAEHLTSAGGEHVLELSTTDRNRIFNLGYFTWVEQQGIPVEQFDRRRDQSFWLALRPAVTRWDELIEEFNGRVASPS